MRSLAIILLAVAAAILYGIAMDQVAARVCIEYFTIGHPRVIDSEDPTLLALTWGVLATWWAGLLIGVPLAICARAGRRPKLSPRDLLQPMGRLLIVTALCTAAAGVIGFALASYGAVVLIGPLARRVPANRHVPFLADLWAHNAAYLAGFVAGIVLCVKTYRRRRRRREPG